MAEAKAAQPSTPGTRAVFSALLTLSLVLVSVVTLENGDLAGADIPGYNGVAPSGSGSGDAILIYGSGDSSIMNSRIRNSIIWGRGAISHENTSILSIKNTCFMDNESTVSGGAVHL